MAILYGEEDDIAVENDDGIRVPVTGDGILTHQYRAINNNRHDRMNVKINFRSTIPGSIKPIYLQAWNENAQSWETLTLNNSVVANTDVDLEASINLNQENYYDINHEVAFRIYQETTSIGTLSVDLFCLHFLIAYDDEYMTQGTTYTDKYTTKTTSC